MKIDKNLLQDLYWDGEEAYEYLPRIKGLPQDRWDIYEKKMPRHPRKLEQDVAEQLDILKEYNFTYAASRHESWWLLDSLGPFYDQQWFDDVLKIVKGGKEASVYLCKAKESVDPALLAAKVYRPRSLRNLRKDHFYREGRAHLDSDGLEIVDERQSRAMSKRTTYGQELLHTSWIEHEFHTMEILHAAGCDVPFPLTRGHNAILMSFIGNVNTAAPTLNGIRLENSEVIPLFDRILENVDKMLASERVHGDLSAYNILYWEGTITLIDFPQAINPNRNPNAYPIFQRDVNRICEYFKSQGLGTDPARLAEDLWTSHGYSTAPNILWDDELDEKEK